MSKDKAPEAAPKKGGKMKKLLVVGVGGTALIGAGACLLYTSRCV